MRDRLFPFALPPGFPSPWVWKRLKVIAEYLRAAAEDPNPDVFLSAVGNVARARGMADMAHRAGLGRESLYKALSPGGNPTYATLRRVMEALDVRLCVTPARP